MLEVQFDMTSSSTSTSTIPHNSLIYLRYFLLKFNYDCTNIQADLPHGHSVSAQLVFKDAQYCSFNTEISFRIHYLTDS